MFMFIPIKRTFIAYDLCRFKNRLNDYVIRVVQSVDERSEDNCLLIFYYEIFFGRPGHGKETLDSL